MVGMTEEATLPYGVTIEVRDACLCLHLQRAARAMARYFDDLLRPFELTNGQFSLLMSLNRPEPPAISSVATLLAMDRTTLTANLKPLQRRGLLTVAPDKKDKRTRRLLLTDEGRDLLARAVPVWREAHAALEKSLPDRNADDLRADLLALSVDR
ncbi:MarR family winged helix-turn-helix transcriptional regulator [Aestuariispira ectoiniformans]|uniref:MarR family winged helix-turn-helix transcriptional regulator n=1 Tax=Aestuariispira ectoiniformans TaxID=2775080 RepID=UPI0028834AD7|nr:MarR family transcriptional regulator [Aestuariispira ectoiniformans]